MFLSKMSLKVFFVSCLFCYVVPELQAQSEVLTNVNGGASWQNMSARPDDGLGANVDLSLSGTELTITDNTNSSTIDLVDVETAIADGTGTDDQTIDVFSRTSTTMLNISLEGDGVATQTVDLTPAIDSLIYRFSVNVDFPNINNNAEHDLTTTTTLPTDINEFPMMFGVPNSPDNIAAYNLKFAAYRDGNDNLHIICANYAGAALDLPPFDLNITVLRGSY